MSVFMRALTLVALLAIGAASAYAQPVAVASGVRYELIERWDVERLNRILQTDMPTFAGIPVSFTPARNAVRLYRVTYPSVVPERGNKPIVASGLVAIPDAPAASFPVVSYQHGTVYGKKEVPSFPDQSSETQLMIALFAGQGYVVMGADYFGMGTSGEPEGYMVKASHQQATVDMLTAGTAVLEQMKIARSRLFLAGWSQGGFVTMAFLERLESTGVAVDATATASAPVDIYPALSGFLALPRKNDAAWVNSLFILSSFSFENYYGVPGLARALLTDEAYEISRKVYEREPFDAAQVPTDLHRLIRPDYFDPQYFASSAYGRLVLATNAYRWTIRSPVRNFYGESDEVISVGLGRLAANYQSAIGAGNTKVEAVSTGDTTHRGTFVRAAPQWKSWFDQLSR
jgi:pimeloyl-ACP methyl ester carboxylesterase